MLRGRRFDARQAERWGVVTEVSPPAEHVTQGLGVAHELTAHSPMALRITKQVSNVSLDAPREAVLLLEQLAYSVLNEASTSSARPSA